MIKNLLSFLGKRKTVDSTSVEELIRLLIKKDVGPKTSRQLVNNLINSEIEPIEIIKQNILNILEPIQKKLLLSKQGIQPILIVGANGVGKTTTAAKLAMYLKSNNKITVVGADAFRAAAREQLIKLLEPNGIKVATSFKHSDPSAIVYEAYEEAVSNKSNILIIDTAGRLHTHTNLMAELIKICKTVRKLVKNQKVIILLVLDGTSGRNGIKQVLKFNEALEVDGLVVTKLDGSSKAGFLLEVAQSTKKPINFICDGEDIHDIKLFDPEVFVHQFIESDVE